MNDDGETGDGEGDPHKAPSEDSVVSEGQAGDGAPEHCPIGENGESQGHKGDNDRASEPSDFDRKLERTDSTIKWFTVVSGVSAAISAVAAIYVASQISGSSKQTDIAIQNIAALAKAAQGQATAMNGQIGQMRRQADSTGNLVEPARKSATAAVRSAQEEADQFVLDERPIVARVVCDTNYVAEGLQYHNEQVGWNYCIKNYGKTTAINVVLDEYISIMGSNIMGSFHRRSSGEVVPGDMTWSSLVYPSRVQPEEFQHAVSTDAGIVAGVRIRYTDLSRHHYSEDVCFSRYANATVHGCYLADAIDKHRGRLTGRSAR